MDGQRQGLSDRLFICRTFRILWTTFQSGETEQIPIMLVGNKSDEESCREVDASICENLSKRWQCGYMETSAKNNTNVKELFQVRFAKDLLVPSLSNGKRAGQLRLESVCGSKM